MNNEPVFFSIVIPTYNRAHLIGKTIDSVLLQTYTNYEIVVVDDGSTDNTEEALKQYASANFTYVKKQNGERAAARNYGSLLAKGNYINWFDSDDIMLPNNLEEAAGMIQKYRSPEIFALGFQIQDNNGNVTSRSNYTLPTINSIMYKGNLLACNPVFVRKDIALQNPFNEDRLLSVSEDYELWLRMAARYPIYCSNKITSLLISHDQRSMLSMNTKEKLIPRYETFNKAALADTEVVKYLGSKKGFFIAKNYLQLSCTLGIAGYKKEAIEYCLKAIRHSRSAFLQKRFLIAIWYLFFKTRPKFFPKNV